MSNKSQESKEMVDETTEQTAPTAEENTEDSTLESDQSKNVEDSEIDYKAELEAAKAAKEKAEAALVKEKKKHKTEIKELDAESDTTTSVDIDAIVERVNESVQEQLSKVQQSMLSDKISGVIDSLCSSPEEKELVLFHYQNTVKQSGYDAQSIQRDLEHAKAIANKGKLEEIRESLKTKNATQTTPNFKGSKVERERGQKLSPQDAAFVAGFDKHVLKK